jgi:hypothetical protein
MGLVRPYRLRVSLCASLLALAPFGLGSGCTCRGEGALTTRRDAPSTPRAAPDSGRRARDAGPPPSLPPESEEQIEIDREAQVRAAIAALTDLLTGRLPEDIDPQTLFDVDLLDDAARLRRVEALTASIAEREAAIAAPAPSEPATDAGAPDGSLDASFDAGPDAGVDGGMDAAAAVTVRRDAAVDASFDASLDASLDAALDASLDAALDAARSAALVDELARLELERDRLRLRFLSLPEEARTAAAQAVGQRRRIAVEAEASRADALRATERARVAGEARRDALERAATSESAIARDLLAERARVEAARGELARWEAEVARDRQGLAQQAANRLALLHELERRLAAPALPPAEADARYSQVVDTLKTDRPRLDRALDAIGAPSAIPSFVPEIDLNRPLYAEAPELAPLEHALEELESERERIVDAEASARWERAEQLAADVRRLDALRVELLPKMSRASRETVLGLGPEGRHQLGRELDQIRLMARFWLVSAWHDAPDVPHALVVTLERSSTRLELLAVLALLVFVIAMWARRDALGAWVTSRVHDRRRRGDWETLLGPMRVVVGPIVVPLSAALALHLLFALLDLLTRSIAVDILRILTLGLAWFYVALTAVARLFVSRLRHGAARAATSRRIFESVRLVLGFLLVVGWCLQLSEILVGHGYLYTIVVDMAWLGAVPIVAILVHRWADDVVVAHAESHPDGFCAKRLRRRDSRARRYLLTLPAALHLGASGVISAFKDLALRFEQSRRAFAFLFRRRLERQTEGEAAPFDIDALPEDLREAFAETPCEPELEIDHFPDMEGTERLARWREGGPGFAVAIVGEWGAGKTNWMRALARRCDLDATIIPLDRHLHDGKAVCRWLSKALDLETAGDVDSLATQIEARGTRHTLFIDHCQNLVVRAIGGTAALETLVELAARTADQLVWICSFSRYTWLYLERARQAQDLFSHNVLLGGWPEEKIVALIRHRMTAIDRHASFGDLVVDRLEGSALTNAVLRTEGEYLRLLWDYADGNPRIAIHYWLRSLVVTENDELRVRLFAGPNEDELEALHEQSGFLLAAIVLHESLTEHEAALTCGLSRPTAAALLSYLRQRGCVDEDDHGQWRVTTHWYRAVIRYLRRKRLLFN